MPDEEKKEFTFIREQIKKKPFYRRGWFIRGLAGIGLAVIFGGVAGITFAVARPWAEARFGGTGKPTPVTISDEETETDTQEEQQTETPQTETEQTEAQEPQRIIEKKELELSDYKKLYSQLAEVAKDAAAAVVTVTGESSDVDWSNQVDKSLQQLAGLVVAANEQFYFVMTESSVLEEAERIMVTFADESSAEAALLKKDDDTGYAVVKVPRANVSEAAAQSIAVAKLGTSANARQGTPVISIGSPLGESSSMAFGMITSVTKTSGLDSQYTLLTTDIIGGSQESGILIDLDGNIIGIIAQNFGQNTAANTITALGITDMKYLLEMMSNNLSIPYLGIIGYEINEMVAAENDVPQGIYIKEVAADSPAMHAGIQMGIDILTEIDGQEILTMDDYMEVLRGYSSDQELKLTLKRRGIDGYTDIEVTVTLESR